MRLYVLRLCIACGRQYSTSLGNVNRGQRFCSLKCFWADRKTALERARPPLRPITYDDIRSAPRLTNDHYVRVKLLERSRHRHGWIDEHIAIAEVALGHALPAKAHVHHVNEDTHDNRRSNLVICQGWAYHQLLHLRRDVQKVGGNPNTDKVCSDCGAAKPRSDFYRSSKIGIFHPRCKPCSVRHQREWRANRRLAG